MTRRAASMPALLYGLPAVTCLLAALLMVVSSPAPVAGRDRPPIEFLPALLLGVIAYAGVGALVASRRPTNPVGWIFWLVGLFLGSGLMALGYADYTLLVRPGSLPGGELAVWLLAWSGGLFLLGPTLIFLLFPDGRLPAGRRSSGWLGAPRRWSPSPRLCGPEGSMATRRRSSTRWASAAR